MSLYKNAVTSLVVTPPRGYVGAPKNVPAQPRFAVSAPTKPILKLVKVAKVINTPHGAVVSGELIHVERVPSHMSGDIGHDEIGFFKKLRRGLKKGIKGVGRGIKKGAKGGFKVVKKTGKVVVKGPRGALKWVARNPLKAIAAVATGPLGVSAYLTHKAIKKVTGKKKRKPLSLSSASDAASDSGMPQAPPLPGDVPDSDVVDTGDGPMGEGQEKGPSADEQMGPDEDEQQPPDAEESNDSETPEDGAEESGDESASDTSEVSGMPNEEWVGLDEIAGDEWVGDDDVAGDDIGAARRPAPKKGPNAALIRKVGYTKKRRQPLPLGSVGTVAAGASATVTVIPQTLFRGRRIVIPTALAPNFTIEDIKIGNISQTAASGSIPGEAFAPTSTGDDNIQMDTCPPGMSISLSVTNTSAGALQFRGVIFGDSVQ